MSMSRAKLKRELEDLKNSIPNTSSSCCLVGVRGLLFCFSWHDAHAEDAEPRPLPPCRRDGGPCCELAHEHMTTWLEPPYNGPFEFEESDL